MFDLRFAHITEKQLKLVKSLISRCRGRFLPAFPLLIAAIAGIHPAADLIDSII